MAEQAADFEPSSASQPAGESSYQNDIPAQEDYPMMEAPESPPDVHHNAAVANQSAALAGSQIGPGNRANGEAKTNHGAPGSSWNNKKWHDEYERASSQLLDQDWNHSKFGG